MHEYLKWDEKIITDFSDQTVSALYNQGYVFGRVEKGYLSQTRSLRINLEQFELSSENRRVLKKTDAVSVTTHTIPYASYDWAIGKLGKDFYDTKFGAGTFSANKIKELLTDAESSNFNVLLEYVIASVAKQSPELTNTKNNGIAALPSVTPDDCAAGYTICYQNPELLHYCYPFYKLDLTSALPNLGLGMMLKAIVWAKEQGKKYVYLGSFQRASDTYKLQFAGLEWWNGKEWKTDLEALKK